MFSVKEIKQAKKVDKEVVKEINSSFKKPKSKKTNNSIEDYILPLNVIIDKVVTIAQVMSEKRWYEYQLEAAWGLTESVLLRTGEEITYLFSRQSGKTETVSSVVSAISVVFPFLANLFPNDPRLNRIDKQGRYRGFRKGFRSGSYAPTQDQSKTTFERIKEALSTQSSVDIFQELKIAWAENNGNTVRLVTRNDDGSVCWTSRIIAATASKTAQVESKTHDLLILEEAQDIDDFKITKSLRPMVAATKGTTVLVGTAGTKKCFFLSAIKRNMRKEILSPESKKLHYFYPEEVCGRYNSDYAEYVDLERERLGEESDSFQMSFKCKFILERGMLITEKFLMSDRVALIAGDFSNIIAPEFIDRVMPAGYTAIASVDFGRKHDSTVLTIGCVNWNDPVLDTWVPDPDHPGREKRFRLFNKHILFWKEYNSESFETQFFDMRNTLYTVRRLKKVVLDGTGLGMPIVDRFNAAFDETDIKIESFVFNERNKSDGYKALISEIIRGRITFPFSEKARKENVTKKFVHQMLDAEKEVRSNGNIRVSAPDKEDCFDDFCDGAMLFNYACDAPLDSNSMEVATNLTIFNRQKGRRNARSSIFGRKSNFYAQRR